MNYQTKVKKIIEMGMSPKDLSAALGKKDVKSVYQWRQGTYSPNASAQKQLDKIYKELVQNAPDLRRQQAYKILTDSISNREFSRKELSDLLGVSENYLAKAMDGTLPIHMVSKVLDLWGDKQQKKQDTKPVQVEASKPRKSSAELDLLRAENADLKAEIERYKSALAKYALQTLEV